MSHAVMKDAPLISTNLCDAARMSRSKAYLDAAGISPVENQRLFAVWITTHVLFLR